MKDEVRPSGIIIAQSVTKEIAKEGVVVGLPEKNALMGRPDPNSFLSIGDHVLYDPYTTQEIVLKDESGVKQTYRLMFLDCIHAIISPPIHDKQGS